MHKTGLRLLLGAYSFSMLSSGILVPIYAFYVQKIGGGVFEASSTVAISYILTGLLTLVIFRTKWSHAYQKECLVVGWFFWLISVCMYCYITNVAMLFVSQCFNGVGNALSASTYDAEYSKQASSNLVHGWSMWEGTINIFSGLAAISGGFIVTHYGFDTLMLWMVGIAMTSFSSIVYYVYREKYLINQQP
ncbi:MAG: MFS transporter [Legionellaceae bacterium]|nr:MFS transporter [Legionellaceae bacterium]